MRILIETIDHADQRYPTTGDWEYEPDGIRMIEEYSGDALHIRVSRMGDWRYEALVGIHEAIEAVICRHTGVTQEAVDRFDMAYEKDREPDDLAEPGDDGMAPYYEAHQVATGIERILAKELGVNWAAYEEANNVLYR